MNMDEDYMSNWSSAPPGSTPHTPMEQAPPPFLAHGVGSSTSLYTTDEEEVESQYPWTSENEQFVAKKLQEYRDNPRNTPFSGRFPPSGVVQQVARAVMRRAPRDQFPHSLTAVRKRILLICAREGPDDSPVEASTFSEQLHRLPQHHPSNYKSGVLGGPLNGNQAGYGLGAPMNGSLNTSPLDYEQFDFSENRNVPLSSPFKEDLKIRTGTAVYNQQPQQPHRPATDEHVLNIVAQRKRDSLKMKRGLK